LSLRISLVFSFKQRLRYAFRSSGNRYVINLVAGTRIERAISGLWGQRGFPEGAFRHISVSTPPHQKQYIKIYWVCQAFSLKICAAFLLNSSRAS
jgi:hypothetical protein